MVPYTNEDIKEATDEIKNSVAAIDKALRAMYNFTFHQVDSVQDTLVRTLLTDGANEVLYDALQAFPHVHDVQRWGQLAYNVYIIIPGIIVIVIEMEVVVVKISNRSNNN